MVGTAILLRPDQIPISEWRTSSPPPRDNFRSPPVVIKGFEYAEDLDEHLFPGAGFKLADVPSASALLRGLMGGDGNTCRPHSP
jgi:hypothetical protein